MGPAHALFLHEAGVRFPMQPDYQWCLQLLDDSACPAAARKVSACRPDNSCPPPSSGARKFADTPAVNVALWSACISGCWLMPPAVGCMFTRPPSSESRLAPRECRSEVWKWGCAEHSLSSYWCLLKSMSLFRTFPRWVSWASHFWRYLHSSAEGPT